MVARPGERHVRRAIEEDEVVIVFDLGELFLENDVGRSLRVRLIFALEVHEDLKSRIEGVLAGFADYRRG